MGVREKHLALIEKAKTPFTSCSHGGQGQMRPVGQVKQGRACSSAMSLNMFQALDHSIKIGRGEGATRSSMTMQKRIGVITVLMVLGGVVQAQVAQVRSYTKAHRAELTSKFRDFLSIPNVAAEPSGLEQNADFLLSALRERGVEARLLTMPGAPPVVYGEIRTPSAEHTIVLYAHYDGQPVTPAGWETPPFKPEVRTVNGEPRIYARGAGDDKAAIFAQLTALDAMKAAGIGPRANIRFVWEGEEEAGSPHLEQILDANQDAVHGDAWLICDGRWIRAANRPSCSGRAAMRTLKLRFMGRITGCTAGITETGRRTRQ
jgi:hypothetical protein